jgi:anti-anti-sigma factor
MSISPSGKLAIIMAVSADQYAVCVRLAGDVDLAGEADLASLVDNLAATRCRLVYIDLHSITFAGSTLINFLVRLSRRLPGHTSMTLCRPNAMTRQLIELTRVDKVAAVCADLPADWTAPWTPAGTPDAMRTAVLA